MSAHQEAILITDVTSYLGTSLAKYLLASGYIVYGQGYRPPQEAIESKNFVFVEFDLSQPIPAHFPKFQKIYHLMTEQIEASGFASSINISAASHNLINFAKEGISEVFLISYIKTPSDFLEILTANENCKKYLKLFLVGDLYGPGMQINLKHSRHIHQSNISISTELTNLLTQAIKDDKIVLEKEGQIPIYPSFIDDVVKGLLKLDLKNDNRNIRYLVSSGPKNSLSVSFEIQKAARISLQKELKLFFEGAAPQHGIVQEPEIRVHEPPLADIISLQDGLKRTLDYFKQQDNVVTFPNQIHLSSEDKPIEKQIQQKSKDIWKQENEPKKIRYSPKKLSLVLVLLILLILSKTIFDLIFGINSLKAAEESLKRADFTVAQKKAESASNSFQAAYNKAIILTYPLSLFNQNYELAIRNSLKGAQSTSSSLVYFSKGAENLSEVLKNVTDKDSKLNGADLESASVNFKKAYYEGSSAQVYLKNSKFPLFDNSSREKVTKNISILTDTSGSAWEFSALIPSIIGSSGKKTYLVLLQNNTELRPGGGFIGSYALIEFENAKLKSIKVDDIYTIDGQLKEVISPPPQITEKLGTKEFYLRDSNWSLDFEVNAKTAQDFFKKETGLDVDGTIAIDLSYIQNLLSKMGPIKLSDFNEEISSENLFEKGEYFAEVGFFPGSTQKKDFFSSLTRNLIDRIINSFSEKNSTEVESPFIAMLESTRNAIYEKHLQIWAEADEIESVIKTNSWHNPVPPKDFAPSDNSMESRDYLAISEANLGANKVNRFLTRTIDYDMTVGKDADLIGTLKITYKNESNAQTWPGGKYVNYLRVYLPPGAGLIETKNGQSTNLSDVTVANINNLTEFATYVEVQPKETKEVLFKYRISKNIKLETTPNYSLYVQKQPGTERDKFNFSFNLPGYLKISSFSDDKFIGKENLSYSTELDTDKRLDIGIARK